MAAKTEPNANLQTDTEGTSEWLLPDLIRPQPNTKKPCSDRAPKAPHPDLVIREANDRTLYRNRLKGTSMFSTLTRSVLTTDSFRDRGSTIKIRNLQLISFVFFGLVSVTSGCGENGLDVAGHDLSADEPAAFDSRSASSMADALAVTKTVRVLYVVPSNAQRSDRVGLVAQAMEHNRQTWKNYGATMTTESIVTVQSTHDVNWFLTNPDGFHASLKEWYWLGNACNEARTVYPEACTFDVNHKYVIFLEVDISGANSGAAAATNFGASVMPKGIIDGVEQGDLHIIGSIGHELGHTFDMPEPDCASQGPTKNIMCNGGYYPHNRLNYLDYPFLFKSESKGYFAETPSKLFDIGQGKVLQGEIWKTQYGMDLETCALSCLSDSQCSTFVHFGTTCEFKNGSLSQTWSIPGYTSAQVKISANGTAIKEAGPIWNQAHALQVCPSVCAIWTDLPWTESSWTGNWWTTVPNQMSVCVCDYNPDVNP